MISGMSAKIRLVRCPRCRQILPELPDILVYECGGCGTRLQAKIRKENAKSTSNLPQTDAEETNKFDHVSEGNESSSSSHEAILPSVGVFSLDQNNGRNQVESNDFNGDNVTGVNLPHKDENKASDQNRLEDFDNGHLEDVKLTNEDQNDEGDKNKSGVFDNEQFKVVNLSNEDYNNCDHQNEFLARNIEQHGISSRDCSSNELTCFENGNPSQFPLSGASSSSSAKATAEGEAEADAKNESDSTFRRSSQMEHDDTKGSTSIIAAHQLAGESISSDILINCDELLAEPEEGSYQVFDRLQSTDTFETTDFVNPSSELSGSLVDLSKSPTTRSSRAYYDDGVSSYEGTDDLLPDRHKHSSKHAHKLANYAASDVRPRRERFLVNSNHEMQHRFRSSASAMPDYATKSSKVDREELQEPTRLGHPVGNWRRLAREEYMPQHPFHRRESLTSHESGSPSNHNGFYNTSFPSQDKPVYTEQEKMKLLRMVYELQDQLNKASLNDKVNAGVSWHDHHIPMYHNHDFLQEENFHNLIYSRYSGRVREGSNWSQQKKFSRIPFSAEATTSRHQVDHSLCCCPQERQCPAQLTPLGLRHNKGLCRVHPHLNLYNSYGSCPSSPQQRVDSQFTIYSRGTKSADQRHRSYEVKKYLREKRHLAKRHLRPIAGGAPFITCSSCWKQLQLPADFLLFKRRCHQLRCGACSEVLKFSLVSRTHLIPYMPTVEAPPPSEFDEYSDAINQRNFTSTSHVSDCPCPDSISCSDDYGHSFHKSYSIDRDPVSHTPFHAIHENGVERNVPNGSLKHSEEGRKFVLNEARNKGKNPVEIYESAGPSSSTSISKKVSSEIEELPVAAGRGGGSPLHRLMGYSSPTHMIFGWGPSFSGTSSYSLEGELR
ncbi:uncharacterized protein LOC105649158 [Jatropha curcas]|uniref:uncharacterized protein LOC105649158 n=1 Tax=Jatropha curcas TaxID=180498 RepID=UPI00189328EF|nr:uncharacterized protein LOC105649158 [Jatropha curcas]XP_012091117.2 uncharacterized protein LOC105649158 [Jatropha curcas]XP_012091118.2 uncharacterized protein LOC105649158 [Jatropha curcas]XP_012091119.2 uncharacterized protein LOC105649158 [Jatropha curcas]